MMRRIMNQYNLQSDEKPVKANTTFYFIHICTLHWQQLG